ncbi:MAG: tail fiber domain-containing protein, partial [Desulfurococcales archaeon]|nr:tail fiber domain-containing protein [Desulfurococcales archaeon]
MKKNIYFYTNLLAWGLVLLLAGNYVFGWTTPTANPPEGDLSAPLDISSTAQTKAGNLTIDSLLRVGRYSSAPTGATGALYYDTTENEFKGYKASSWDSLGGATPAGSTGYIQFNDSGALGADSNLFWDNTNKRLGIGTTSPGAELEIMHNSWGNEDEFLRINRDETGWYHSIKAKTSTAIADNFLSFYISNDTGGQSEVLKLVGNGNVGIGTTSPGATLHVQKTGSSAQIKVQTVTSGTASLSIVDSTGGAILLRADTGNSYINAGNVGIGTTGPAGRFHIVGDTNPLFRLQSPTYGTLLNISNAGTFTYDNTSGEGDIIFKVDHGNKFNVQGTGDSSALIVDSSSGNVGIGTTGPYSKLNVADNGTLLNGKGIILGTVGNSINTNVPLGAEVGRFEIGFPGWRDMEPKQIGAKIVAIRLNNYQENKAYVQATELAFYTGGGQTGNNSAFHDTSGERVRIDKAGNVGIGTTSPGYKLDVSGTGRFTGNLTGVGFFYSSDESLKKNVQKIETPLAKIMKLDGISFDWKESGKKSI